VSYTNPIGTGSQSFVVTVTDGGSPLNGALVCVQKGTEVYATGTTNSSGVATLTIAPLTEGTMDVTVTKQNLLPWEGTCTISGGEPPETIEVSLDAIPASGVLPFSTHFWVQLSNLTTQSRRAAARIDVQVAGGSSYSNWRSGWTNLGSGAIYTTDWGQNIPALSSLVGNNLFTLVGEDVTPSPYNQPPYYASGDTDIDVATVTGTD
jgi:hypothetical protein